MGSNPLTIFLVLSMTQIRSRTVFQLFVRISVTPTPSIGKLTIAKPTSAFFKAGPSFVPSPVTATTSRVGLFFDAIIPLTSTYLSCGDDRANTRNCGQTLSNNFWSTYIKIPTFKQKLN